MSVPQVPADLFAHARNAREKAHAPYSQCRVGAALRTREGGLFAGCNVENASYGATICAERAAICAMVSQIGRAEVVEVCVVTDARLPFSPCGVCRQVLWEFGPDSRVWWTNLSGQSHTATLRELLPHAFSFENLQNSDPA